MTSSSREEDMRMSRSRGEETSTTRSSERLEVRPEMRRPRRESDFRAALENLDSMATTVVETQSAIGSHIHAMNERLEALRDLMTRFEGMRSSRLSRPDGPQPSIRFDPSILPARLFHSSDQDGRIPKIRVVLYAWRIIRRIMSWLVYRVFMKCIARVSPDVQIHESIFVALYAVTLWTRLSNFRWC